MSKEFDNFCVSCGDYIEDCMKDEFSVHTVFIREHYYNVDVVTEVYHDGICDKCFNRFINKKIKKLLKKNESFSVSKKFRYQIAELESEKYE